MSLVDKRPQGSIAELLAEVAALKAERDRFAFALTTASEQLDTTSKQLDTANKQLDTANKQLDTANKHVKLVEQRAERLKLQVKRLAYLLYGRRSEKLSAVRIPLDPGTRSGHPGSRSVATGLGPIEASATGVVSWDPCRQG